jgi:hypothetical protein
MGLSSNFVSMLPFWRLPVVSMQTFVGGVVEVGGCGVDVGTDVGIGVAVTVAVAVAGAGVLADGVCWDWLHPDKTSERNSRIQRKRKEFDGIGQSLTILI